MAKQEELKSFQELITAEKQKAKPKNSLRYGRKIGETEREALEKPQKEATLAYANTGAARPEPAAAAAQKPAREKPRQRAEKPAAKPQKPKKQAQKSSVIKETPAVKRKSVPPQKAPKPGQTAARQPKKPEQSRKKRPHQLTTRENISYLPAAMKEPAPRKRHSKKAAALLISMIVLIGIVGFLGYQFIRADEIEVRGAESFDAPYVIALSGIRSGTHIFRVDKRAAAAGIAQDPHLVLQNIEYAFPNKITLVVSERKEAACFEFMGTYVITDYSGIILGHVESSEQPQHLPVIRGINVTEFALGAKIRTDDTFKQNIMTILLENTTAYQLTDLVREVDLTDTNNITLGLSNGMRVVFGQADQMEEKLAWLQNILKELEKQGKTGGVIDLSSVQMPTYLPPQEPSEPASQEPAPAE